MIEEWKIDRTQKKCEVCAKVFAPSQEFFSGIIEVEKNFTRRDYCTSCWNPQRETYFSYWVSVLPPAAERPKENVEVILDFFKKLSAEAELEPEKAKLRYLLALLLMRRRRLKLVRNDRRDTTEIMVLEKSWDGETMDLPVPFIDEHELDTLKLKIQELLDVSPGDRPPN